MRNMERDLFWKSLEPEHPKAEAFCRKLAGNRHDRDDLYQDSLLKAIRKFGTLRDADSFRPWLYRIIINRFKSQIRSPWRRRLKLEDSGATESLICNPSDSYDARRWLERAFRILTPAERALIVLFEIEGWSIGELSEIFGKPEGTIKSKLSRSRKKMREEISRYLSRENSGKLAEGGRICVAGKPNTD